MTLAEEEGAEDKLIRSLVGEAVKAVFGRYADPRRTMRSPSNSRAT
jgi:hypothetical protein